MNVLGSLVPGRLLSESSAPNDVSRRNALRMLSSTMSLRMAGMMLSTVCSFRSSRKAFAKWRLPLPTNTSSALNAVIRSLDLRAGDEVLLGDAEYGGMELLWEYVARRTGATITRAPFDELMPSEQTRIVFCSHIEWISGRVNDVAALCARARAAGALSIVDGARHCSDVHACMFLLGAARAAIAELPRNRPPKPLRRLTGLAAIAAHDVMRNRPLALAQPDAGRGMASLLHYMRGTLPRG